ncbi:conjugal transfer protein TraL [Maridesulfovibrio ferrireducens]|uniref:nucleotide-binding protein n=1 Tax=Maridesulfovibrio ferrireducens TaxID=246191 RepID=UPI001A32EEAE|nr:conjugal transfer protein TraL [Maridesulfovibrio ferrireducens]MBI9112331.1 conjugal transfer protein TraL [Maridesulfovibrio ferrireducens]
MATINMILQGKGGVGKSLVASLLTQHLLESGKEVHCVDTDPVNATFAGYKSFNVTALDIMNGDDIDPRRFDTLVELMMDLPDDSHMVIDNGAATFVPLASYLADNNVFELLHESGHQINLHTVITGGQALPDTLSGLNSLLKAFDTPIYIWLNGYFGQISLNGKNFEEFKVFTDNTTRFPALIRLPQKKKETFGRDLENLLAVKMSFHDAQESSLPIMTRQRLRMTWNEIRSELEKSNL